MLTTRRLRSIVVLCCLALLLWPALPAEPAGGVSTGGVSSSSLAGEVDAETAITVTIIAKALNVRAAPHTGARRLGRLTSGARVETTGKSADGAWWRIRFNGQDAYIAAAYAIPARPASASGSPSPTQQSAPPAGAHPTLADLWEGRAAFIVDVVDTGLPVGESDTVVMDNGELWSYLHASDQSTGVRDQCGAAVPFPGCTVVARSYDGGRSFASASPPTCQLSCRTCPCSNEVDHTAQQQYPRVAYRGGTWTMVYEWQGKVMLRQSADGLAWGPPQLVRHSGIWLRWLRGCTAEENIGQHPNVPYEYECLAGGPPGVFVDGATVYVFFAQGQNPGSMGCAYGAVGQPASSFQRCQANPLFTGAATYGPSEARDASANAYFDFRTISSAEVVQVGSRYYMLYEGVRGPGPGDPGDTQFGLGLARSITNAIDGPWEKFPGNPMLVDLPGNIGLGHADLVEIAGQTVLFTSLDGIHRSRLVLAWRP